MHPGRVDILVVRDPSSETRLLVSAHDTQSALDVVAIGHPFRTKAQRHRTRPYFPTQYSHLSERISRRLSATMGQALKTARSSNLLVPSNSNCGLAATTKTWPARVT